jgi:hypothetical protein
MTTSKKKNKITDLDISLQYIPRTYCLPIIYFLYGSSKPPREPTPHTRGDIYRPSGSHIQVRGIKPYGFDYKIGDRALKGQCHEIFDSRFFFIKGPDTLKPRNPLGSVIETADAASAVTERPRKSIISNDFLEFLGEFDVIFETALARESGP